MDINQLKRELNEELVTSGKYAELSTLLRQRLEASGWTAQVAEMTQRAMNGSSWPDFDRLLEQLDGQALQAVDPKIQQEFEHLCTEWMRQQLTEERLNSLG